MSKQSFKDFEHDRRVKFLIEHSKREAHEREIEKQRVKDKSILVMVVLVGILVVLLVF